MEEITKEATRDETELKKRCQDITLEEAENCILSGLKSAARSVIAIGYYLKCIRDGKLYRDAGYDTIWDYAQNTYGFSKSTASRYMARNDKFSVDGNSPVLAKEYRDYSKAQLQEMLTLDDNQLEQVTPDMTVKAIREKYIYGQSGRFLPGPGNGSECNRGAAYCCDAATGRSTEAGRSSRACCEKAAGRGRLLQGSSGRRERRCEC
ncbi:hypothetical protein AALB64_15315 [Lachnospiraceae bacterium 45-P1]